MNFKNFYKLLPHLGTKDLIEYYSVFSGFPKNITPNSNYDIFKMIEINICDAYETLKPFYVYSEDPQTQQIIEQTLIRLARGDRKSYSIYKKENISQPIGKQIYKTLFETKIIEKEFSREKPIRTNPKQLIRKNLRKYKIEDKIRFCDESTRFWFTLIAPNANLLQEGKKDLVLDKIINEFEKYVSFTFEGLSEELLKSVFFEKEIIESGSYWDRKIEIDILLETQDGIKIAGESKWKNHKLCKNVLNSLQKKCELVNLDVTHYALFSKSGFSKELMDMDKKNLLLFDLKDFERLYLD